MVRHYRFSNYLEYVHEDNPLLWGKIKKWLADWVDVYHRDPRLSELDDDERAWLCRNFTDRDHLDVFNADFRCHEIEDLL